MSDERGDFEDRDVSDFEEPPAIPIRLILFLVGIALLVIFISQNNEEALIELLWFDGSFPLSILIIGSAFLGALIAMLGGMIVRRKRHRGTGATGDEERESS